MPRIVFLVLVLLASRLVAGPDWLVDGSSYKARATLDGPDLVLDNGLIRRTIRLDPGGATIAFDNLMTGASMLRGVKPEATVTVDGTEIAVGGLLGQPNYAYLDPAWLDQLTSDPNAMTPTGHTIGPIAERLTWARVRHHAPDVSWPPPGVEVTITYDHAPMAVTVAVHYELYDALPLLCKWITVANTGDAPVMLDSFTSELFAAVEPTSFVGGDPSSFETPNMHIESDYAMGGSMQAGEANSHAWRWASDPQYQTQVHYERKTPCLLLVGPDLGPGVAIAPGETFESSRVWELVHDSTDRERNGLAIRKMYRTIAPWVTENPLMLHARFSNWDAVKLAIDQCAEVGFEMVILTFGSGFNIENNSAEYLAQMKQYADYAESRGVEIGGYSLLASRSVGAADDVVSPPGERPMFGNSPCLQSGWGKAYFEKLYKFYPATGFSLLEHDGSYPGDACASTDHPGHAGLADSRWTQWKMISDYYGWCLANGVSLNVPDWYYLSGATKCGMGYRETNWSLPRAQQVIHARQNIYDGCWTKTPSMGWMFVPLTEYHGGGGAATIEPLAEHLDHYERMLAANLSFGVQACYRGPRLYDEDRTKDLVSKWVSWFKEHRDILESDMVHGRRADGRDVDWMLHVNPSLATPGMLVAFNPTPEPMRRTLRVNLYYTGLTDEAVAISADGTRTPLTLGRDYTVEVPVVIEAGGMSFVEFERP